MFLQKSKQKITFHNSSNQPTFNLEVRRRGQLDKKMRALCWSISILVYGVATLLN